jgi:hypothetical protein
MGGAFKLHEKMRKAYKILVSESQEKRPLGRPRHRLEDNIKINLTEIGGKSVYWIQMNEYRVQW